MPAAIKWIKQRSRDGAREASGNSKIISAVAVGPHQRVVTVEVGPDTARIWLVLGVTPQAVTCLHTSALPVPANLGVAASVMDQKVEL
jgi:flagellar protein FliO/FliZ